MIELLVVVAIIAVLISILLPCLPNLKAQGEVLMMYAHDEL